VKLRFSAALLLLVAAPATAVAASPDELEVLRGQCIAAARETQQAEQAVARLRHQTGLLGRDAAARRRGLDESRPEQARLLGVLEFLARNPTDRGPADAPPLDRLRGEMLVSAAVPGLRAQAAALSGEIARITALKQQITGTQAELERAEQGVPAARDRLAQVSAQRQAMLRELLPADPGEAARSAKLGREAKDLDDLIKRAEAVTERRDKGIIAETRAALPKEAAAMVTAETADRTRPAALAAFDPPQSALLPPVSGPISPPAGGADAAAAGKPGLVLSAPAGGGVVAPFDGRVVYAGGFRDLGLVLIIRHAGGYYSVLAGLGRVDVDIEQWVLAGEPVGVMPAPQSSRSAGEAAEAGMARLYFELRRDGRPVDPQPWLARSDDGSFGVSPMRPGERNGDQRVRQ
jgi:septal ring factor EnvC (AmiA/AmiB activator)